MRRGSRFAKNSRRKFGDLWQGGCLEIRRPMLLMLFRKRCSQLLDQACSCRVDHCLILSVSMPLRGVGFLLERREHGTQKLATQTIQFSLEGPLDCQNLNDSSLPTVIGRVSRLNGNECTCSRRRHCTVGGQRCFDNRFPFAVLRNPRLKGQLRVARCGRFEAYLVFSSHRTWRRFEFVDNHQFPGSWPIHMAVQQRADNAAIDHACVGLMVLARLEGANDALVLDETLDL